jgi:glycosyltransferase involved in cell wall biosynthesis
MSSPFVSVVIPCLNQGHYLRHALESVLAQTLRPAEVVVVDDGSTDDTAKVAREYAGVRCVQQPNRGLASARNVGAAHTTGEHVVFLDADDRLRPDALRVGVRELTAHPTCALVWGRCVRIDEHGRELPTVPPPPVVGDAYEVLLRNNFIWTPAVAMFRRSVCGQLMHFNPAVDASADYDLYLRIVRRFPIHGHSATVAEYRLHGASMSSNASVMLASTMEVLRAQRPYVARRRAYARAYDQGRRSWQSHYGEQLLRELTEGGQDLGGWRQVGARVAVLARYYPRGLAGLVARRVLQGAMHPRGRTGRSEVPNAPPPAGNAASGATQPAGEAESDLVSAESDLVS